MKVTNAAGEVIKLTKREQIIANYRTKEILNSTGAEIDITTLTALAKKVTEQKFFEIRPSEFVPVVVGNGAWATDVLTYRSFALGDDFETGIINTGADNDRLAKVDTAVDGIRVKIRPWAKTLGWSIFDLEYASRSGNWELVTALEESRLKNWQLGIQRIAFLGARGDSSVLGLYTQTGVTVNTTLITAPISSLSATDMTTFLQNLVNVYRANSQRTAWPTHFTMPESDFLGLMVPYNPAFPNVSKLQWLEENLKIMCRNKNFKLQPCAYGDNAYSGLGVQKYVMHNYDEKSIRMDLPVDYTNTLANSLNNFNFQNVGYGQFTGVKAYRPAEMIYFQY